MVAEQPALTIDDLATVIDGRGADDIAAAIAHRIRELDAPAGTPLPTVRALAAHLGVSASTVSDAWKILRTRGMIETDRRRGTTVRSGRSDGADRSWHVPVAPGALATDL